LPLVSAASERRGAAATVSVEADTLTHPRQSADYYFNSRSRLSRRSSTPLLWEPTAEAADRTKHGTASSQVQQQVANGNGGEPAASPRAAPL